MEVWFNCRLRAPFGKEGEMREAGMESAQWWFNVLTLAAIILGPIFAIQIQVWLEKRRDERRRKMFVFRELMITRSTTLSPRHVEALNAIQVEFNADKKDEKDVVAAWQNYIAHLNDRVTDRQVWNAQVRNLLANLLLRMAESLNFSFNEARIKTEAYSPQRFVDIETENDAIRQGILKVFSGEGTLKVQVVEEQASTPLLAPKNIPRDFDPYRPPER